MEDIAHLIEKHFPLEFLGHPGGPFPALLRRSAWKRYRQTVHDIAADLYLLGDEALLWRLQRKYDLPAAAARAFVRESTAARCRYQRRSAMWGQEW